MRTLASQIRILRPLVFALSVVLSIIVPLAGQTVKDTTDDLTIARITLLSDLQAIDLASSRLNKPLARALAKSEIADAAWVLDRTWSKKLLQEAYELTLPGDDEAKQFNQPAGAPPPLPTAVDRIRINIRNKILRVASREAKFAKYLIDLGAARLGQYEGQFRYANLASQALNEGDVSKAIGYLSQSFSADPSQITAPFVIRDLASKDRAAADQLILQYFESLRSFPLSSANQSAARIFFAVDQLVFPPSNVSTPGAAVMRAYVDYVIDSLARLEQSVPGSIVGYRGFLLKAWLPLQKYAPEMTGAFLNLERLTRKPGEEMSLPAPGADEAKARRGYDESAGETRVKERDYETAINSAINRGEFGKARKLIDKLTDTVQKSQWIELVNVREAANLTAKGDTQAATILARQLKSARSILQVYPAIVSRCVANKDQECAKESVNDALRQLKIVDDKVVKPIEGLQKSLLPTEETYDPVVLSLSQLAEAISPVDGSLALYVLEEAVRAANVSKLNTSEGRTGFESAVFRKLAAVDETRVKEEAMMLTDSLEQIVAFAGVYQWKSEQLSTQARSRVSPKELHPAPSASPVRN